LALLGKEFIKNRLLREIVKTTEYTRPSTNMQLESSLSQHNALVKPGNKFYYPKALGIKTGYTIAGGYSIVSAAEDENRKLIAVVLGCEKIEQRYKDAIALFEAGFNEKKVSRMLFSKGFDLFNNQIEGGNTPLQAYLAEDIVLQYYPSEEPVFKTTVFWQTPELPIALGQKVGEMRAYSVDGMVLASAPLYAVRAVEATLLYRADLAWKKAKRSLWDNVTLIMATGGILILASTFYYAQRKHKKSRSLKAAQRLKKGNKFLDR
jgi:D-alanyl-D-alanine carboxypeptidase (penicillin-binding protein 5/6)